MANTSAQNYRPKAKVKPASLPLMPQHQYPLPFARLLTLGEGDDNAVYQDAAAEIRTGDVDDAVRRLTAMALDESYYQYFEGDDDDPRGYTRVHAVRVLEELGEQAAPAIVPLLPLLAEEDDWLREEMPIFFASVGPQAIEPLVGVLTDVNGDTYARGGASESLSEIGQEFPEARAHITALLEQALVAEKEDETLAGFVVCSLLDVGAKESVSLIEQAFKEERVDESIVQMADVQEHFGLPVTYARRNWQGELGLPTLTTGMAEDEADTAAADEAEPQKPYVAAAKVGRNDPCPCGSGKKYKKCHGQ